MSNKKKKSFDLGQLLVTRHAADVLSPMEIITVISRHSMQDWSGCCREDAARNREAINNGDQIMSVYKLSHGRTVWVITDAEDDNGVRNYTTVLLPEDY